VHLGALDEFARPDHGNKGLLVDEVVVDAVDFAWPWRAGGIGD
jgi:hypothetical protein